MGCLFRTRLSAEMFDIMKSHILDVTITDLACKGLESGLREWVWSGRKQPCHEISVVDQRQ